MKIIGLTGGIGTGKSTVAKFLAELGAAVIDMDKIGHEVLKKGTRAWGQVLAEFGKNVFTPSGNIDRNKLGRVVFFHSEALERLNQIVHPAMDNILNRKIQEYRRQGIKVVVLEAAAMLEAGKASQADEIWVTVAPRETVLGRIKERSDYSIEESKARIRSQITNEKRVKQANVVIDTDCTLEELKARVKTEWEKLLKRSP